jgi:hypothetical protein
VDGEGEGDGTYELSRLYTARCGAQSRCGGGGGRGEAGRHLASVLLTRCVLCDKAVNFDFVADTRFSNDLSGGREAVGIEVRVVLSVGRGVVEVGCRRRVAVNTDWI